MTNKYIKCSLAAFVAVSMVVGGCKKDKTPDPTPNNNTNEITVKQENTAFVNKFSGTKCGPCGGWGWTAFDDIMAQNPNKTIFAGVFDQNFVAQDFITPTANDWKTNIGINSWPTFVVNSVIMTKAGSQPNTIDVVGTKTNVKNAVDAHINGTVVANVGFKKTVEGDKIKVKGKIQFFQDATGEYYWGAYATEDGPKAPQYGHASYPNAVEHHHVLRQVSNAWGEKVSDNTSIASGFTAEKDFELALNPSWNKDKVEVFFLIFKKQGNKYTVVNASKDAQ